MGGDVGTIKEKLGIAEVIGSYVKLEKAGSGFKARCPFHSEKTPSFFISPLRQSFYCFGCGEKGDIFSFIEKMEGLDFRRALKVLAERAGVEVVYEKRESKTEKDKIHEILLTAAEFFEEEFKKNKSAQDYIKGRGLNPETLKEWRIGYAPSPPVGGWRMLYSHLTALGYESNIIIKAGLAKISSESKSREPYDVFRDRIIFPLSDASGRIIAFSGRALAKETEPKYLNSPDTPVFTKSEVLYGLDKAKADIRKKDYAILVEGQMDLVLSHQAGVKNTVASSGTAFTSSHLGRLKHLSSRIILAFDGDKAGQVATYKASILGISLGFEVKVANLPEGSDPADIAKNSPLEWKEVIRKSLPAVEYFFNKLEAKEKDSRKLGKLVEKNILPMIKLLESSIEQSHFVSLIAKRTGIKEELIWEDLKKAKIVDARLPQKEAWRPDTGDQIIKTRSQREQIEERLQEIKLWKKEMPEKIFEREEIELEDNLAAITLKEDLNMYISELAEKEKTKDSKSIETLTSKIQGIHNKIRQLEERRKIS